MRVYHGALVLAWALSCHCWGMLEVALGVFTALRRCGPGVGCCLGRCGYDREPTVKPLGAEIYESSGAPRGERSGMLGRV